MQLRTAFGTVNLRVWRGKNPADGTWGIPIRKLWGLAPHQQLSPALEDKLAYFATVAGTYESAARLARKLNIPLRTQPFVNWFSDWVNRRWIKPEPDLKPCPCPWLPNVLRATWQ